MRVLILSADSEIGAALAQHHSDLGDDVTTTTRNNKPNSRYFELLNARSWPLWEQPFDRVYYTLAVAEGKRSRTEQMHVNAFLACDWLEFTVARGHVTGEVVVLTSEWGSITRVNAANNMVYRMTKAALNMGVAVLAQRYKNVKWILMQPGLIKTKMTALIKDPATLALAVDMSVSVAGINKTVTNNTKQFVFLDHKNQEIPF